MKVELLSSVEQISQFMHERSWYEYECSSCGKTYFTKKHSNEKKSCNWRNCCINQKNFLTLSKKKKPLSIAQVNSHFREYFNSINYKVVKPRNMANFIGDTDLVIAGVQILDQIIHHETEFSDRKLFVSQPCIRMQYQDNTNLRNGISTSFVNICTEELGFELEDHLFLVDHWYSALSKLSLYMNDFTIILRTSKKNWGTGEFSAIELFFSYGGLELGDASYFSIPQKNRSAIPISDIGMGLERLMWAVNKTNSCFDLLTPWVQDTPEEILDSCKSICLLALCGIRPSNKGPGFQLKRFAKILSQQYYNYPIYDIIFYYYKYWCQFIEPKVGRENVVLTIRLEIERQINEKIGKIIGISPAIGESTQEFMDRLVYNINIDINYLHSIVKDNVFK
jgi:hypothetical protein